MQIQEDLFEQYHGSAGGRIRIWYGLRQILNASDSLLLRTKAAADKHKTGIHMVTIFHPQSNKVILMQLENALFYSDLCLHVAERFSAPFANHCS